MSGAISHKLNNIYMKKKVVFNLFGRTGLLQLFVPRVEDVIPEPCSNGNDKP